MSNSIEVSYGTTLKYNSSGTTYTELTEILDLKGPMKKRKVINVSAIADTITFKKGGRLDAGEVTFQCGFVKAGFVILNNLLTANTATSFKLENSTNTTCTFSAIVTDVGRTYPDDEKITYDVTLSITGDDTVA